MKRIFMLIIVILISQLGFAQNHAKIAETMNRLNNDTLVFFKQEIIGKKESYTGQPLDSLLKNLPLRIIGFSNSIIHNDKSISPSTSLWFYSYPEMLAKISNKVNTFTIVITWETPLSNNEISKLSRSISGGNWTNESYKYYKDKIISNISMVRDEY